MSQHKDLYAGLVPFPGRVFVYFRVGVSHDESWKIIESQGVEPEIRNPKGLGTAWRVAVPVGRELEFAAKFSKLLTVDDATVEYIKKE
jgi:hypothetical protein